MTQDSTATRPWFCPQDETCPSASHDNEMAYFTGCRSGAALVDNRRYKKLGAVGLRPERVIPMWPTRRRVQALNAIGWTREQIAGRAGLHPRLLDRVSSARQVKRTTAEAVAKVYNELCGTGGPSETTRERARRKGFAPPLAWVDIDDPDEVPTGIKRKYDPRVVLRSQRVQRVAELTAARKGADEIADILGVTVRFVERARAEIRQTQRQEAS